MMPPPGAAPGMVPPPGAPAPATMPPPTAAPINPADRSNIIVLNNEKPSRKTKKKNNTISLSRKLRKIEPSSLLFGFSISPDGRVTDLEQANPYMLDTKRLKRKSVPNLSQYYKMEDDDENDDDDNNQWEKYRRRSTDKWKTCVTFLFNTVYPHFYTNALCIYIWYTHCLFEQITRCTLVLLPSEIYYVHRTLQMTKILQWIRYVHIQISITVSNWISTNETKENPDLYPLDFDSPWCDPICLLLKLSRGISSFIDFYPNCLYIYF